MSDDESRTAPGRGAASLWPCLIGAGGLLVFLLTLNPWVSLSSLGTVARASGWSWQSEVREPMTAIILYPFRLLPEFWIPLTLNLSTALGAAVVLALLARSVGLQWHDRALVRLERENRNAAVLSTGAKWMPSVLAALACGLQLSFWEHATAASGEMINLLLFAVVIWCLLEFRTDRRRGWLSCGVFLYAAGVANSWTLIVYFPVLLATIVGLKGLNFFRPRFLIRLSLWGLAGLSLYLVLPCVDSVASISPVGFWPALKANWKFQATALMSLPRGAAPILVLTSLVPLLVITYRWRLTDSRAGEGSPIAAIFTRALVHFIHAALLGLALWITLDPPFSPRNLALGSPLLTEYYLGALVVGYCVGYFVLLGAELGQTTGRARRAGRAQEWARLVARTGVAFLLAALSVALAWRNFGQIRITNSRAVREFAQQLCAGLPAGKSVVLSDDPICYVLARAELAASRHDKNPLLLETRYLPWSQYHILMARQAKLRWPVTPPTNRLERLDPPKLVDLVSRFSAREPVVYLHPSFGYYFEWFTDQPHGLVHYLTARGTNGVVRPILDDQLATANERFWQECWTGRLQALARQAGPSIADSPHRLGQIARALGLTPERNFTAAFLGAAYSRGLDDWGVRLQRLGRWEEAGVCFQRALELKPDNLAAWINREGNQRRRRGEAARQDLGSLENRVPTMLAKYRSWEAVLAENGPLDEPTFLFESARVWLAGGQFRQASTDFARCAELEPGWVEAKLGLAQSLARMQDFDGALRITEQIQTANPPQDAQGLAQLLLCRVNALQGLGRTNDAAACIELFAGRYREQTNVVSKGAQVLLAGQQAEPTLVLVNQALGHSPNSLELLASKSIAEMQLSQFAAAIETLTTLLGLDPTNQVARLNRAISSLRAGRFAEARADYEHLEQLTPESPKVLFGLGEIASHNRATNAAIQFYQRCLAAIDPHSSDYRLVSNRLQRVKGLRAD